MHDMLQLVGGGFFLLNKIFFWYHERAARNGLHAKAQSALISGWLTYLIGLPPIVAIFIIQDDWIAATVEASTVPAMALGLFNAIRHQNRRPPRWLEIASLGCIMSGLAFSLYKFRGLSTISQWLEIIWWLDF